VRRGFGDDSLGPVTVGAVDSVRACVFSSRGGMDYIAPRLGHAAFGGFGGEGGIGCGRIFHVEYTDLGISCGCDNGTIRRKGHEFHGEDVGAVSGLDTGVEVETGVGSVDVDESVVAA
jgi:hypothetical protein